MMNEFNALKIFLQENKDSLTDVEVEIIKAHIAYLENCNENLNKTLLTIENDEKLVEQLNSSINKIELQEILDV